MPNTTRLPTRCSRGRLYDFKVGSFHLLSTKCKCLGTRNVFAHKLNISFGFSSFLMINFTLDLTCFHFFLLFQELPKSEMFAI